MATKKAGSASKAGGKKAAGKKSAGKKSASKADAAEQSAGKKAAGKKAAGKKAGRKISRTRELIDTGTDKRYVRRDEGGRFYESDDVGRSLSQDVRRRATKKAPRGQGDRGD